MAYRRKTLRAMLPTTRKLARLIGELESVSLRAKHIIWEIQRLEGDSLALHNGGKNAHQKTHARVQEEPMPIL